MGNKILGAVLIAWSGIFLFLMSCFNVGADQIVFSAWTLFALGVLQYIIGFTTSDLAVIKSVLPGKQMARRGVKNLPEEHAKSPSPLA